jgi:3-hydroxy-9,10-secoandrosta-1,3,5(10)-triene-9,17-dione monooxygenase reductase component
MDEALPNGAAARLVAGTDDGREYRDVMSLLATGVVAVTGSRSGVASGFTVGSCFSASLEPRLVGFCVARKSATWAFLRPTGRFCVNLLAADQRVVSESLARPGTQDKLVGVAWQHSPHGLPLITGAMAWIVCDIAHEYGAGDHSVVLGRVQDMVVCTVDRPLIFFRRTYHSTAASPG